MPHEDRSTDTRRDPAEVCTLPRQGLAERLAWIRAEILPHAVASERLADGVALELEAAPGVAERLDRLVALEQSCCAGIGFVHLAGHRGGRRLEIHGVSPDAAVLRDLVLRRHDQLGAAKVARLVPRRTEGSSTT